ncbi:hypothetical protein BHE74_00056200, partial [Ensete ventricosum]
IPILSNLSELFLKTGGGRLHLERDKMECSPYYIDSPLLHTPPIGTHESSQTRGESVMVTARDRLQCISGGCFRSRFNAPPPKPWFQSKQSGINGGSRKRRPA